MQSLADNSSDTDSNENDYISEDTNTEKGENIENKE